MNKPISELVGTQIADIICDEPSKNWLFKFDSGSEFRIESLWRISNDKEVLLTDTDHEQKFGLPAPVNAMVEAKQLLGGKITKALLTPVGDVHLTFSNGNCLEILIWSAGYESWTLNAGKILIVAQGGGTITQFGE